MKENYTYPLDYDAPYDEMIAIINMFQVVEKAYETGIEASQVMKTYQTFKTYIKSIGEEKRLGRDFESVSGYSLYKVVQKAKESRGKIKLSA